MKTIGLLGGMSWESTVTYYQIINEAVREKPGGLHSATRFTMEEDFFRGRLARQFKLDALVPDLAGRNELPDPGGPLSDHRHPDLAPVQSGPIGPGVCRPAFRTSAHSGARGQHLRRDAHGPSNPDGETFGAPETTDRRS